MKRERNLLRQKYIENATNFGIRSRQCILGFGLSNINLRSCSYCMPLFLNKELVQCGIILKAVKISDKNA